MANTKVVRAYISDKKGERVEEIEGTLKSYQSIVNGYIDMPFISRGLQKQGIDIVINDEGKILELQPRLAIVNKEDSTLVDYIAGDYFFIGVNEDGETISLTDEQIKYLKENVFSRLAKIDIYEVRYVFN